MMSALPFSAFFFWLCLFWLCLLGLHRYHLVLATMLGENAIGNANSKSCIDVFPGDGFCIELFLNGVEGRTVALLKNG